MRNRTTFQRQLAVLTAVCLCFSYLMPVRAAETEPVPEEILPAAEPVQTESVPVTEPVPETTAPQETGTPETEAPEQTEPGPAADEEAVFSCPYDLYFGLLHAHTDLSDGLGTVEEAFRYAAGVEGLDFFAVTDHSNSFDNSEAGSITADGAAISADWAAGKAAAAAVTDGSFLGIFGYEMTWQEGKNLGHICTFGTPGWQSRDQEAFGNPATALEAYYQTLTAVPGSLSQFCHPGTFYGEFENFSHYRPEYDQMLQLLEVAGEGSASAYAYYTKALDAGWHVAPSHSQNNHNGCWGNASPARTVVLADALTEESLFQAIREHRVYATADGDLRIYFELDGCPMGSILAGAEAPEITLSLLDPTDTSIGTVEVITEGGAVAASLTAEGSCMAQTISVPAGYRYYYLRITQPDGDIAVTAPVWVEDYADMGISAFTAGSQVCVQGQPVDLNLTLYNHEAVDLRLDAVEFYAGDRLIHSESAPGTVTAMSSRSFTVSYTHDGTGTLTFRVLIRGIVPGEVCEFAEQLTLRFRSSETVTGMLIDAGHGNERLDDLENLKALAAEAAMTVTPFTGDLPLGGEILVVTAPQTPFSDEFLQDAAAFVKEGGTVILCGLAGDNSQLNTLLAAVGSTMGLKNDTALDEENNGGTADALSTANYNPEAVWCENVTADQFYTQAQGCTVDPGSGIWLVKTLSGDGVLLACEDTGYGGTVFAAGGCFLSDSQMPLPKNHWDPPRISQTILEAVLDITRAEIPLTTISQVRQGTQEQTYLVKGYVTAGTANPYTIFPDTLYLQDSTGGIAVLPFRDSGIQIGAPMEVLGRLTQQDGNMVLDPIDYRLTEEDFHRYSPRIMANETAMDYIGHGGELLKVQGKVVSLKKTGDGKGLTRLELKDVRGGTAIVEIEDTILSGVRGTNTLAEKIRLSSTVQAMGILHINSSGETVLRVRNCDEVVHIPAEKDYTNPGTGDSLAWLWPWIKTLRLF